MDTLLPRVYPILDTALLGSLGAPLLPLLEGMLEGGARMVQLRHKGHFSREMFETARRFSVLCREAGATPVVDDRVDVAALVDAGVHVGQEDLPPALARKVLGEGRLLGYSTHNAGQLEAAASEPADYLAFGPVFATTSKENPDPVVGLASLALARKLTARPLVAIGGITLENAKAALDAGADCVAVIRAVLPAEFTRQSARERMEAWLKAEQ